LVPCILVTSRSAEEDKTKGREAGAADYIVKGDFNQEYLLSRISELMLR
jgi:two-component system chemotaxis sensor kinase CheA